MARKAAIISIDFAANAGKMQVDLEKGKAALRDFGSSGVGSTRAVAAEMRVLEGNISNNTRAVSQFLVQTLKLGPALNSAFAVFGAAAAIGMVTTLATKTYDFFKGVEEAPKRIAKAFEDLNQPLHMANDELQITNDRLANELAKLEGHRENTLKLELHEAQVEADKLAESIGKALDKLEETQKKFAIGKVKAWFTGQAGTSEDEKAINEFTARMAVINAGGSASVRQAATKGDTQAALDAQKAWNKAALDEIDKTYRDFQERLRDLPSPADFAKQHPMNLSGETGPNTEGRQKEIAGVLQSLEALNTQYALTSDNITKGMRKPGAEAAAEARKNAAELEKFNAEELNRVYDKRLEILESAAAAFQKIDLAEQKELRDAMARANEHRLPGFVGPVAPNAGVVAGIQQNADLERLKVYRDELTELDKLGQEATEVGYRFGELASKASKWHEEQYNDFVKPALEDLEYQNKAVTALLVQYGRLTDEISRQSLSHQKNMIAINGSPTDPLGTLAKQQALDRQDIEDRYENSLKLANSDLERANLLRERNLELQKLQDQMEEAAAERRKQMLADLSNPIIGALSSDITKAMTGQKTSFGKDLEGAGRGILQKSIEEGLHRAFDRVFGGGKPDGTRQKPFWVKLADQQQGRQTVTGPDGLPQQTSMPQSPGGTKAPGVGSSLLGILKSLAGGMGINFGRKGSGTADSTITYGGEPGGGDSGGGMSSVDESDWGGMMASGGDVDPGKAYGVADAGEFEVFTPRTAGTITPAHKLGGASVTYNIDARGADLGAHNRIARQIEASHQAAVSNSLYAQHEQQKRTPRRSR